MFHHFNLKWFRCLIFLVAIVGLSSRLTQCSEKTETKILSAQKVADSTWTAPTLDAGTEPPETERQLILYGRDLIVHTARYFGPHGTVAATTNGMNCQNCHLDAGTKPWGINFGGVYANYPKHSNRSGRIDAISKRVNDCFERSLNGKALDSNGKEMKAFYAYFKWLGKDVPKNKKPYGSGLQKLLYMDRAADTIKGEIVYSAKCGSCHGSAGEGQLNSGGKTFAMPPLWGQHSYNDGAGLYRLSNFAAFVKSNMPLGQADHDHPLLSNEEAWDVAAYVNSRPRPHKDQSRDWPDLSKKPVDFPFGPYTDGFSQQQHKFGPFKPIEEKRAKR